MKITKELIKKSILLFERKNRKETPDDFFYCFSLNAIEEESKIYYKLSNVIHSLNCGEDFVYKTVYFFLEHLNSLDKEELKRVIEENDFCEYIDGEVDIYTSELLKWLSSNINNVNYLTEVLEEYGTKDGFQLLTMAQYKAIEEVISEVLNALNN